MHRRLAVLGAGGHDHIKGWQIAWGAGREPGVRRTMPRSHAAWAVAAAHRAHRALPVRIERNNSEAKTRSQSRAVASPMGYRAGMDTAPPWHP